MSDEPMISRREADAKIDGLKETLQEIKDMLREALDKSGAQAIAIALIQQDLENHKRWKYIIGTAALGALAIGIVNRFLR